MYTANEFIDTVQDTKLKFVDAVVKDEEMKKGLNEFVEAQRVLTKSIVKNAEMFTSRAFSLQNICNPKG